MHGVLAWKRTMKLIQVDGLIFFLKLYIGKGTLKGLYFNVDLMSTFYKVKVRNNLSCGLLILTIDLIRCVRINLGPPFFWR
jgi:hypothetical protein